MIRIFLVFFSLFPFFSWSQKDPKRVITYDFRKDMMPREPKFPRLYVMNYEGYFAQEYVPKLGNGKRNIYVFPQNSGLKFINEEADNFIKDSYTVEMYFRYDDAQLLIYGQLLGEELAKSQGKYVHLVTTRNFDTKEVFVYVNGVKVMDFVDEEDLLLIKSDSQIEFFAQNGANTTSGAIALIKIYNFFMDQGKGQRFFKFYQKEVENIDFNEYTSSAVLSDIYFERGKADLMLESTPLLDQLVQFLELNPSKRIELQGHTDNQGDFYKNVKLSKDRTDTIKNYLVNSGIEENRIDVRGFGPARPRFSNFDDQTRSLNRRVELIVLDH